MELASPHDPEQVVVTASSVGLALLIVLDALPHAERLAATLTAFIPIYFYHFILLNHLIHYRR
jgi:hypothetical protein